MAYTYPNPNPLPPWDLSVEGTLLCMPDIYGNRFAPPESEVWFRTSDQRYISISSGRNSTFGMMTTDPSGVFSITSTNHPRIIPNTAYFVEIKNTVTGQVHTEKINPVFDHIEWVGNNAHFKMGEIQLPWTPVVPVIANINGREFKYPAEVARALGIEFKSNGTTVIELFRSFAGQPAPDAGLDALLAIIEAEGRSTGPPAKSAKFLSEVAKAMRINLMQIRRPLDVVTLALEKCSNTRFNTRDIKDFSAFRLDTAAKNAFGQTSVFSGLYGRASFSTALFAAGSVARGQKITLSTADAGPDHVTSVSV